MFTVNYRDPRPIYEQIMDGLRRMIITGAMQPEERLPSVRDLARQMAINPNTIQRAYRELETAGYVYSVPGKGSFVAADRAADLEKKAALLRSLADTVRELKFLGVPEAEIEAALAEGGEQA